MTPALHRLRARWQREDGTATMEFTLMVPLLLMLFMASFESGLLMVRHTMLERALDMTMRELRLGHYVNPTHALLKTEICNRAAILPDCENTIRISLDPIDTTTWALPATQQTCVDRAAPINPITEINTGQGIEEQVMLVRVCVLSDVLFPTTGIGFNLPKTGNSLRLIASSAFVNEPS